MAKNAEDQVCSTCGSDKVEELMWVRIKSKGVRSTGGGDEYWCPKCDRHIDNLITREEYEHRNVIEN